MVLGSIAAHNQNSIGVFDVDPMLGHLSIGQIGYVVQDVDAAVKAYYEKFGIGN